MSEIPLRRSPVRYTEKNRKARITINKYLQVDHFRSEFEASVVTELLKALIGEMPFISDKGKSDEIREIPHPAKKAIATADHLVDPGISTGIKSCNNSGILETSIQPKRTPIKELTTPTNSDCMANILVQVFGSKPTQRRVAIIEVFRRM